MKNINVDIQTQIMNIDQGGSLSKPVEFANSFNLDAAVVAQSSPTTGHNQQV